MKRLFWLGLGVAAGIGLTRKAGHAARQATPAGIAENLSDAARELAGAIGAFGADVRAGMSEREHELADEVERRTGVNPTPSHAVRVAGQTWRDSTAAAVAVPARGTGARSRRAGR